ncbi:MAG: Fic family protein [Microthrixaceae bacterium]
MPGRYISQTWAHDPSLYAPPKYRKACRYEAFIPDVVNDFNPTIPAYLAGIVSDAEAATRSLNDRARPALRPLARLLLRTESIASSKVEGLQVDARSIARAEAKAAVGKKVGPDVAEVLANIEAMELAVDETAARAAITVDGLVDIHGALMRRGLNSSIAGRIRDVQNWIGGNDYNPCGADFVPPPPDHVVSLLADLCEFCNSDHLPPLIQAAVAHAQFETIHPFEDGNGRTGRALIHVLLRRRGLAPSYVPPISVVLAANKGRYIDGLTQYRDNEVGEWIERFAVAAARAATLAERYLGRVHDIQEGWRAQLRRCADLRADAAAWAVIDELPGHPVITVPVATAVTGRSKSSTAVAVDQLVDAGILLPLSESKRNRAWEASGLLDLLADLEAAR